jgi:hypothetical protein
MFYNNILLIEMYCEKILKYNLVLILQNLF